MKINSIKKLHRSAFAVLALTLTSAAVHAQTFTLVPGNSSASINFNDTLSFDPGLIPGVTNTTVSNPNWNGTLLTLGPITDIVTGDFGQGEIAASPVFPAAGGLYGISFPTVNLTQAIGNSGFAKLTFNFNVQYSITGGTSVLPPQFPGFTVSGTVQPAGFAQVTGFIDYIGLDAAGAYSVLDTVNYGQIFTNPPASFAGITVPGIPVNGGPLNGLTGLPVGSTLTLNGQINFIVDPASISATSFPAPEPGSALLALSAGIPLLLRRRRA